MGAFEAIKGHASWSAFNLFKEHVSRIANILHKVIFSKQKENVDLNSKQCMGTS
jgi:hypothetical protein